MLPTSEVASESVFNSCGQESVKIDICCGHFASLTLFELSAIAELQDPRRNPRQFCILQCRLPHSEGGSNK